MATQADITVFDGQATPVSHILASIDNWREGDTRFTLWRENIVTLPDEGQVRCLLATRKLKSGVTETRASVVVPVMETAGTGGNQGGYVASPKVAYEERVDVTVYKHPRSTKAGRTSVMQIARNLLNNVATSVAAVSAGQINLAFQDSILPS